MPELSVRKALRYLRQAPESGDDAELLRCALRERDEAALGELVRRHGPMVLGVCRRLLRDEHDAEDAFQATFLVLVRKAGSLRGALGGWLHEVAYRTALAARGERARRRRREGQAMTTPAADPVPEMDDLREVLDEEVRRLPQKYRAAVVLCYLEGLTYDEAARQLGCPRGTVATRLARARARLQARLARRGITLAGASLVAAPVPAALAGGTVRAALLSAAGEGGAVSARVAALAAGVAKGFAAARLSAVAAVCVSLALLTAGAAGHAQQDAGPRDEGAKRQATENPPAKQGPWLREYKIQGQRIEAGFIPDRTEIVLGEWLHLTFTVKNIDKNDIGFWFGGDYRGTGRHQRYKVEARDADGKLVRDPRARPDGTILEMGGLTWVITVEPGKACTKRLDLLTFRVFERPGVYEVKCRFGIVPGRNLNDHSEKVAATVETSFRLTVLPRTEDNIQAALKRLVRAALDAGGDGRTEAVAALCRFAGEREVPELMQLVREGGAEHQMAAIQGLALGKTPAAERPALAVLREGGEAARAEAAKALGEIKTVGAVAELLRREASESPKVLEALLPALGRTGTPRALKLLAARLDSPAAQVRRSAVRGLAELGGDGARAALLRATSAEDIELRAAAAGALHYRFSEKVRPEWLMPLIRAGKRYPYGGPNPQEALSLLAWSAGRESPALVVRCLDFRDPAPRGHLYTWVFQHLQGREGVPQLKWHDSADTPQQLAENREALRTLKHWLVEQGGGEAAKPKPKPRPVGRPEISAAVAKLLGQLGSKKFAEREAAARALAALADEALPALRWASQTADDLESRRRAAQLAARVEGRWLVRQFTAHPGGVTGVAWCPHGREAVTSGQDGQFCFWDLEKGKVQGRIGDSSGPAFGASVALSGTAMAAGRADGGCYVLRTRDDWGVPHHFPGAVGQLTQVRHRAAVLATGISPRGRELFAGAEDGSLVSYLDWERGRVEVVHRFSGHTDGVCAVAFLDKGKRIVSASLDATLRLWDAATGKELRCLRGHHDAVWSVAVLPGNRCLTASCDRTVRLWDLQTGKELRRYRGHTESVYAVAAAPCGKRFVSGGHDGTVRLWEIDSGREILRVAVGDAWIEALAVAPNRRHVLAGCSDGVLRQYEMPK